jgi:hypothetical protein
MGLWNVLQKILKHLPAAAQTAAAGATLFLAFHILSNNTITIAPKTQNPSGNGNFDQSNGNDRRTVQANPSGQATQTIDQSVGDNRRTINGSPSGQVTQGNNSPISGDTVNLSIRGVFTVDNSETVNIDMSVVATGGSTNIQNLITSISQLSPSNSVGGGSSGIAIFVPRDSDQPLPPIQSTSLPPLGMGGIGLSRTTIQKNIYIQPSSSTFSAESIPRSLVEILQPKLSRSQSHLGRGK